MWIWNRLCCFTTLNLNISSYWHQGDVGQQMEKWKNIGKVSQHKGE